MHTSFLRDSHGNRLIQYRSLSRYDMGQLEGKIQQQYPDPELVSFWNTSLSYLTTGEKVLLLYRTGDQLNSDFRELSIYYSDLRPPDKLVSLNTVQRIFSGYVGVFTHEDPCYVLAQYDSEGEIKRGLSTVESSRLGLPTGRSFISIRFSDDKNINRILVSPGFRPFTIDNLVSMCAAFNGMKHQYEVVNRVRDKFREYESKVSIELFVKVRLEKLRADTLSGWWRTFDEDVEGTWEPFKSGGAGPRDIEYVKMPERPAQRSRSSARTQPKRPARKAASAKVKRSATTARAPKAGKKPSTRASSKPKTKKSTSVRAKPKKGAVKKKK